MYKERSFQIKSMIDTYACSIKFKYGKIIWLEWIRKHYMTEIANKPLDKLMESGWWYEAKIQPCGVSKLML